MTLSAIAREAGVSTSTVSRYVRGELRLSPKTEGKIRAAMDQLGLGHYQRAGQVIALVVPELANPYFSHLAEEVVTMAARRGVETTILVSGGSARRENELIQRGLGSKDVAGTIFVSMTGDPSPLSAVPSSHPVVVLDESLGLPDVPFVGSDNYGGAYQATAYLLSLGHRNIALLTGPRSLNSSHRRREGFEQALLDHGIDPREQLIEHGPYSETFGANVLPRIIQRTDPPTAVFACSDIVAIGLMSAAGIHGVSIPGDLSLIGFDGIGVGNWMRPRLATVVQPYSQLADRSLDRLSSDSPSEGEELLPMILRPAESARSI